MGFDWKNPDYVQVFAERIECLNRIRAEPKSLPLLKAYYREHPAQFVTDWGCTSDPRNVEIGLPVIVPFILFPRQVEWIEWVVESWRARRPGVTPKSRESGVSWVAIALSCTLCLFHEGMAIGFGSRKEEYVDKIGAPKSLFWKARKFIELLPPEFRNGFDLKTDAPHMRIQFRATDSIISGEGGDNIGRGDRASIYFVDEAAYLEHPEIVDAALSQTTNCRIDVSTANGIGGPFHRKVVEWPAERVFRFHWREDPRKDDAWYAKQVAELDPVTLAQEVDIDFAASLEGVLIPSAWVQAAIDAHLALKFNPTGARLGALDVADEGFDLNAFCGAHGVVVDHVEEWTGKGSDIFRTTQRAFDICDEHGYAGFKFDADGVGSSVRGDARVINDRRVKDGKTIVVESFRGSAGVLNPESQDVKGRKNQDFFKNLKAQSWWGLRLRFQKTYRAVREGADIPFDELISLSSKLPNLTKICAELSQPTYDINTEGKIIVDKAPEGARSPNLADAIMIRFSSIRRAMIITSEILEKAARLA